MPTMLMDGWPLCIEPESPASLHTLALLERLPSALEVTLALPLPAPFWLTGWLEKLPRKPIISQRQDALPDTPWGRIAWEQRYLPQLARCTNALGLHTSAGAAVVAGALKIAISPAEFPEQNRPRGLAMRLRRAIMAASAAQARQILPSDLHPIETHIPTSHPASILPPFTSRLFTTHFSAANLPALQGSDIELPDTFVLYHGPGSEVVLHRLFAAWTWAAGPVGEVYPLLLAGLDQPGRQLAAQLAQAYQVASSVRLLPSLPPTSLAALYQRCTMVFAPAQPAPWGDPLLHALACARPVVSIESPAANLRLGPAAYLARPDDHRALGAALLSVLVEESVRENLSIAALKRSAAWPAVSEIDFAEILS